MFTQILSVVALIGFLLSLLVHILALTGVPVHVQFPLVWGLHAGAILLGIPTVFICRRYRQTRSFWLTFVPRPLQVMMMLLFVYAFLNFFGGTSPKSGHWEIGENNSSYTFVGKGGSQPEVSTLDEYNRDQAAVDRLFSGHWMLFYFAIFAILRSSLAPKRMS